MVSQYLAQFSGRLQGLVFVTTERAAERFGAEIIEWLGSQPGAVVIVLDSNPVDVYAAVDELRPELPAPGEIRGVVILGNYEELPARAIQVVSAAELAHQKEWNTNSEFDMDRWRVWNDDLYGTFGTGKFPDVPVSRVPIVPSVWIDENAWAPDGQRQIAYGLRSDDFSFASSIFAEVIVAGQQPGMESTPPDIPLPGLAGDEIGATRSYLMLHSMSDPGASYTGASQDGLSSSVGVALSTFAPGVAIGGTAFSGACWGALIAALPWAVDVDHMIRPRSASQSIALALVDRGAIAIAGMTGLHYVPDNAESPVAFGALLHRYFWQHLAVDGTSPAEALYRARVQYMDVLAPHGLNTLARATVMKSFWSATCLGLGW